MYVIIQIIGRPWIINIQCQFIGSGEISQKFKDNSPEIQGQYPRNSRTIVRNAFTGILQKFNALGIANLKKSNFNRTSVKQKTENRKQKTETENRKQKTENRKQKTENRKTEMVRPESFNTEK